MVTDPYRRNRTHLSLDWEDAVIGDRHLVDHAPGPEAQAVGAEEARLVATLLQRLPDRQRAVVELRLAGLAITEIAAALEITESAAKSMQVRAYRTLRALLQANPTVITREFPQ